ncbi:MAG: ABC transporter ATP-binding protein [Pusillimonas sp.]|nr:ABC transporter ATP-binding protein [Pusillimonas sp.]
MTVLINAQGLNTFYGESHILFDVNLKIQAGESVGLLGRNGMGKTTLIRTLMGHIRPASGNIAIRDKDHTRSAPYQVAREGVAYVPEGRGIFPNLNVRENLLVAARSGVNGRNDWTYKRVLEAFPRLTERLGHGGQQLSGGEQQMLAIGRALMTNPDILILDEATEGLAPLIVAEIWRIIDTIRKSGVSTLIVDRNFRKVLANTDRCVVLEKGVVVQEKDSTTLSKQPELLTQYLGV